MRKPLLIFLLILFSAGLCFSQDDQVQYMKIHRELITVNDSLCYQVRKGFSRRDKTPWEPFCGALDNFYFISGYEREVIVKKYDPHADTIFVIKEISRSSTICYEEYMRKKLKEKRMRLKEEGRNDTIRAIPVKRRR